MAGGSQIIISSDRPPKEMETLENICSSNEKEIDNMVYKLYDLTVDEIKIVEGII